MKEILVGLFLCMQVPVYVTNKGYSHTPFISNCLCDRCQYKTCNHSKTAKVCFWKKEEARIYGESCKECNLDIPKKRCHVCKVDYHEEKILKTERTSKKQSANYMCYEWIYGEESIFTGWYQKYK